MAVDTLGDARRILLGHTLAWRLFQHGIDLYGPWAVVAIALPNCHKVVRDKTLLAMGRSAGSLWQLVAETTSQTGSPHSEICSTLLS